MALLACAVCCLTILEIFPSLLFRFSSRLRSGHGGLLLHERCVLVMRHEHARMMYGRECAAAIMVIVARELDGRVVLIAVFVIGQLIVGVQLEVLIVFAVMTDATSSLLLHLRLHNRHAAGRGGSASFRRRNCIQGLKLLCGRWRRGGRQLILLQLQCRRSLLEQLHRRDLSSELILRCGLCQDLIHGYEFRQDVTIEHDRHLSSIVGVEGGLGLADVVQAEDLMLALAQTEGRIALRRRRRRLLHLDGGRLRQRRGWLLLLLLLLRVQQLLLQMVVVRIEERRRSSLLLVVRVLMVRRRGRRRCSGGCCALSIVQLQLLLLVRILGLCLRLRLLWLVRQANARWSDEVSVLENAWAAHERQIQRNTTLEERKQTEHSTMNEWVRRRIVACRLLSMLFAAHACVLLTFAHSSSCPASNVSELILVFLVTP